MRFRMLGAASLLFAMVLPQNSSGQTPKPPVSFGSELTVIAVPVFVTDKEGKTVGGLTVSDFEMQDGGKPVAIDSFVAVSADTPPGLMAERTSPAMRRQFLFLFDLDFTRPINIERARRAAKQFVLKDLMPGDLAAVGTVMPAGFKAILGFTSDRAQVAAAIDGLGLGGSGRDRDPLSLVYDVGGLSREGRSADLGDKSAKADAMAEELKDQIVQLGRANRENYTRHVVQFLGGFQSLARTLDSIKGRKQIILFSEGFSSSVLSGASSTSERAAKAASVTEGRLFEVDSEDHFGSSTGQSAMEGLFNTLKGSDVVVHTVDLGGLGDVVNLENQEQSDQTSSQGKSSLAEIAQNSGGRFVRSANNIEAGLGEILAANRNFYVLAFSPSAVDRGKPRKLSVKVKRPGLSVSHRATYTLPDLKKPDGGRSALESAEIIAKGITGGSIKLKAYVLPYRAKDGKVAVPVVIQIPGDALQDAVRRKQVGLQVYGYLTDQEGGVLDFFQATPALDPAQIGESLKKSGVQIITTFAAAPGPLEVRVLVRDPVGATWGSLRLAVDVPAFAAADARFASAPMVVDDPFGRVALPTTTQRRPNRDIPFRLDDRPITVEADPVLKRGAAREICVYLRPGAGASPAVEVDLVGTDGAKHAQKAEKISVVRDADGFDRVVFFVSPSGVEPGDYALTVSLAGATSASAVKIQ